MKTITVIDRLVNPLATYFVVPNGRYAKVGNIIKLRYNGGVSYPHKIVTVEPVDGVLAITLERVPDILYPD